MRLPGAARSPPLASTPPAWAFQAQSKSRTSVLSGHPGSPVAPLPGTWGRSALGGTLEACSGAAGTSLSSIPLWRSPKNATTLIASTTSILERGVSRMGDDRVAQTPILQALAAAQNKGDTWAWPDF